MQKLPQTEGIKNSNTRYANIYGLHDDGITPALIGRGKNGVSDGLYFTYYSSGLLNIKMNYTDREIDGEYVSYSEQGDAIYKAYYKKGVEEQVEIKDSPFSLI
jgi:antitoxin component YwqK of YwqJK toxin-antitoxin module